MKRILKTLISFYLLIPVIFLSCCFAADQTGFSTEELQERIVTGNSNSAYIDNYHNLWTWGYNLEGELFTGDRNDPDETYPSKVASDVIQVSYGYEAIGVVKSDHSLWTAGRNNYGQLGNGASGKYEFTAAHPNRILENVKQVSMGDTHSAAVTMDGSLYTWGLNNFGQLGKGYTSENEDDLVPQKVFSNVKYVCCGDRCTAIITNNNELYMFGVNFFGKLGTGNINQDSYVPVKILDNVKCVSLGSTHSGAVTYDGTLYMWGANSCYQLGIGSTDSKSVASPVEAMKDVKQVALGHQFSVVLKNDGSVFTIGQNFNGSLGVGSSTYYNKEPVQVLDKAIFITASNGHAQALQEDGSLWVWGQQLGLSHDFTEEVNQSYFPYRLIEGFKPYNRAVSEPLEGDSFNVSLEIEPVDEYSRTGGGGNHNYHETVRVTAYNLGRDFIGWFDGDTLVSKDEVYHFVITRDINLVAKYVPRETDINPELKSISFKESSTTINIGQTKQLTVEFDPANYSNKNLTWKSEDPNVVTVENGVIKGISSGFALVSATADKGKRASIMVKVTESVEAPQSSPSIYYKTHVENIGWQDYVSNGATAGTSGQCLRLEGIYVDIPNTPNLGLEYRTHVENIGWQNYVGTNQLAGTTGQALRLEAIQIRLTGSDAALYDVYYRVHAQDVGWMNWACNDAPAGTAGFARRLEAIQIRIMPKGSTPQIPADSPNVTDQAFIQK